jgi:hypothetical protein
MSEQTTDAAGTKPAHARIDDLLSQSGYQPQGASASGIEFPGYYFRSKDAFPFLVFVHRNSYSNLNLQTQRSNDARLYLIHYPCLKPPNSMPMSLAS